MRTLSLKKRQNLYTTVSSAHNLERIYSRVPNLMDRSLGCPRCLSTTTEKQIVRSADDLEFDFLHCRSCDHRWIVRKAESDPASDTKR